MRPPQRTIDQILQGLQVVGDEEVIELGKHPDIVLPPTGGGITFARQWGDDKHMTFPEGLTLPLGVEAQWVADIDKFLGIGPKPPSITWPDWVGGTAIEIEADDQYKSWYGIIGCPPTSQAYITLRSLTIHSHHVNLDMTGGGDWVGAIAMQPAAYQEPIAGTEWVSWKLSGPGGRTANPQAKPWLYSAAGDSQLNGFQILPRIQMMSLGTKSGADNPDWQTIDHADNLNIQIPHNQQLVFAPLLEGDDSTYVCTVGSTFRVSARWDERSIYESG